MTSKELQVIKYQRLSVPEKILLKSFNGLKEYVCNDDPNWIYYKSDKGVFYTYNEENEWLVYSYELISLIIQPYFSYNFKKMNEFVQNIVEKKLKLKVDAITAANREVPKHIEKQLKLKI